MRKYLPSTFFISQEHYLIHLVGEIEKCGPLHTRSMWMLERNLKSLKALVRQIVSHKGSIVEGYIVYQTMVYITQYIPKFVARINVDYIWDVNSIKKI